MPAWLAPVAAAGANVLGGLFTNQANRKEAQRNRQFQQEMSNTGYQRAAADLEAAGLNKYAMYQGTHSASTPGGSQAQQQNPIDAVTARLAAAQVKNMEAQAEKTSEEAGILAHERALRSVTVGDEPTWRDEQMAARRARIRDMAFDGTLQPHILQQAVVDVQMKRLGIPEAQAKANFYREFGQAAVALDKMSGPAATAASALGLSATALRQLFRSGPGATARSVQSLRGLFKAPAPRRAGTWEKLYRDGGTPR